MSDNVEWWDDKAGFFGKKYMEGDDSVEGFIPGKRESLAERTKREVEGILHLTKIHQGAKILDIPCGYGRHSIALANKGFSVTGMDINTEHLDKAKDVNVQFLKKDMRDIGKENHNKFNVVINMFYSFGFFKTDEDNAKVMKEFYNALKEDGKLLLHTDVSPEMFKGGTYKFKEERTLKDGKQLLIEEHYDQETKRIEGSWTILNNGDKEELTPYSVRIYTKEEFETLAKQAGFTKTTFYGSFEGDTFTQDSPELIMVAEK